METGIGESGLRRRREHDFKKIELHILVTRVKFDKRKLERKNVRRAENFWCCSIYFPTPKKKTVPSSHD